MCIGVAMNVGSSGVEWIIIAQEIVVVIIMVFLSWYIIVRFAVVSTDYNVYDFDADSK